MKFYAVIDTNVIVSSVLSSRLDSPVTLIWDYILDGYIVPMYNEEILEEYSGVLKRSKFNLTEDQVNIIVEAIKLLGEKNDPVSSSYNFEDLDDKVFYEVALSREDSFLVTGNQKHFPVNERVVSPYDMVQIVEACFHNSSFLSEP